MHVDILITVNIPHYFLLHGLLRRTHLVGISVQSLEILAEEFGSLLVTLLVSGIVGEVLLHGRRSQLLLEQIDLVQEKNYRSLDEPL